MNDFSVANAFSLSVSILVLCKIVYLVAVEF